jgi:protein phosphatase
MTRPLDRPPLNDEMDVFGVTDVGKVRKINQDHFLLCSLQKFTQIHGTSLPDFEPLAGNEQLAYLAMVADGVGGGAAGEEASRLAIEAIVSYVQHSMHTYYRTDPAADDFLASLTEAAMDCHASVLEEAKQHPEHKGMATTLTVAVGVWPHAYVLQVGDSRCYLLMDDRLVQITRDQTLAEDLVSEGILTRSDAANTQWAHVLSSAIGGSQAEPRITRIDQAWNAVVLLCSDGLTKHVSDEGIRDRLMAMESAEQVSRQLVQDALDGGGTDNVTVVVGRVQPHGEGPG